MSLRTFLIIATILTICSVSAAQAKDVSAPAPKPAAANNIAEKIPPKSAREIEAERLLKERRANAQSLLISLAADARSFNDMVTRARTLARVASVLWSGDRERARTMFGVAWDAAEVADQETLERARTEADRISAKSYSIPQPVRREVIRLAASRDRPLAEEFIEKMKEQTRRANGGVLTSTQGPLGRSDMFMTQRLDAARQLLAPAEVVSSLIRRRIRVAKPTSDL